MEWLASALLSTLLFAVVSILDKRLVAQLFPTFTSFTLAFGGIQFFVAIGFFVPVLLTVGFDGGDGIPWAAVSGVCWAVGLSLFFYALSIEEVSRAAPMQSLSPVFTSTIAVTFFGDSVSTVQWAAIAVIVLGAVLINLRKVRGRYRIARGKAFVVLVLAAATISMAYITSDEATARMNIWATQGFQALFLGLTVMAFAWRPRHMRHFMQSLRDRRAAGVMVFTEGVLAPLAVLTLLVALSTGPVSLVSAVAAVRPLAILVMSIALSTRVWNVLNEPLDRQTLLLKSAATALIVGGVMALGL